MCGGVSVWWCCVSVWWCECVSINNDVVIPATPLLIFFLPHPQEVAAAVTMEESRGSS